MDWTFVELSESDRKPVIDIFNHYAENSFAAYAEQKVPYEFYDRLRAMAAGYPAVSMRTQDGEVAGFAFLHPYNPLPAFKRTAEISYFLRPDCTHQGLGRRALEHLVMKAKAMGIDTLLANISSLNEASLAFHRKHGFRECGRFEKVGRKLSNEFDVVWMQKRI